MQCRQFYASITATGQLYFDMPTNSRIRGVVFSTSAPNSAVTDSLIMEVTTSINSQVTTNDALGVVAAFSAVGGAGIGEQNFYAPADAPIKAGERVYLNYTESGTGTWATRVLVWFD